MTLLFCHPIESFSFSSADAPDASNGKEKTTGNEEDSTVDEKPVPPPKVGLFELFKFATPLDAFLIVSGLFLGRYSQFDSHRLSLKVQLVSFHPEICRLHNPAFV